MSLAHRARPRVLADRGTKLLIGGRPMLDEHRDAGFRHLVWAYLDGMLICFHLHDRARSAIQSFTGFQTGLDLVCIGCAESGPELQPGLNDFAKPEGLSTSETRTPPYGSGLSLRDADGIALELLRFAGVRDEGEIPTYTDTSRRPRRVLRPSEELQRDAVGIAEAQARTVRGRPRFRRARSLGFRVVQPRTAARPDSAHPNATRSSPVWNPVKF